MFSLRLNVTFIYVVVVVLVVVLIPASWYVVVVIVTADLEFISGCLPYFKTVLITHFTHTITTANTHMKMRVCVFAAEGLRKKCSTGKSVR